MSLSSPSDVLVSSGGLSLGTYSSLLSRAGRSFINGMAAMLSAENFRLPSSCQCSSCSSSTAPTKRVIEASFGTMPTTRVRRFTSSFSRSSRLVLHTFFQWGCGKWRNANTSSRASAMSSAALGKRSASELARSSQRLRISAALSWANTERRAAVTMP